MTLSVLRAAIEAPDQIALVIGSRETTFAELAGRVRRRIASFERLGMPVSRAGDRPYSLVGASDESTLELLYALIETGRLVALVHPRLTSAERHAVIESVNPSFSLDPAVPGGSELAPRIGSPTPDPAGDIDAERGLAILFTSGTTGRPRGVVLSRRAFVASALASAENLGWREGDRWLLGLPIAHVGGLSILTRCLIARRAVVVPAEVARGERLDAAALIRTIDESRVTLVSLVPTQLEWLLAHEPIWSPPAHLRAVLLGGAHARPALLERAADRGVPVLTSYGLTEACSQVTTQRLGTLNRGEAGAGAPMRGTELRLEAGAIQIRGPTLFSGYFPPAQAPALDAEGWLTTDDLGRFDAEGRLHVLGRGSDLIITGGENVFPAEVEGTLEECEGIAAACVFGVPDDTWGELVAVAIVASREGPPSDAALESFQRDRLAQHRRPRLVAFLPALSLTPAGKLDRAATARRARPLLHRL